MLTALIDYDSGNLHSAAKAFERMARETDAGEITVTSDPEVVRRADRIVLPGDGAFPACRDELFERTGLYEALREAVEGTEGWALYSESLGKDIGLYTDPYSDFGRLSMEIFRAARLVVDTGIHAKKWTREQAVQYYLENIPNPEGDVRAEIDRYIVWPGPTGSSARSNTPGRGGRRMSGAR